MYNQLSIKLVRYYNCIHQWTVFGVVQTMYIDTGHTVRNLEWTHVPKMEQKHSSLIFAPFSVF